MNKISNIIIGCLAVISLIVGIVAYNKVPDRMVGAQGPQGAQGPAGRDGLNGSDGSNGVTTVKVVTPPVVQPASPVFGAATGPEISGPFFTVGGVRQWNYRQTMTLATTTPCRFPYPTASSTLAFVGISIDSATSTAGAFTIATSTTGYASTTVLSTFVVGATGAGSGYGYHGMYIASSTSGMLMAGKSSDYVLVSVAGAPGDALTNGFTYDNSECSVGFRQIQY